MNTSNISGQMNSGVNLNYGYFPQNQIRDELNISNNSYSHVKISQSSELRIASLECRIETLEKMVKFYDNLINLKHEERKNEFNITCSETMSIFNSRIENIEKKIDQLHQNQAQIYQELMNKIDAISSPSKEKQIEQIDNNNANTITNNINSDTKSEEIKLDSLMYKNELLVNNLIEDKLISLNTQNEKKINEILSLIQELNKISEDNEYEINELKENVRNIQTENVDVIKVVSVHTEKTKQIDYIIEQLSEVKEKFTKLMSIFGEHQKEEEDFLQNYLNNEQHHHNINSQ